MLAYLFVCLNILCYEVILSTKKSSFKEGKMASYGESFFRNSFEFAFVRCLRCMTHLSSNSTVVYWLGVSVPLVRRFGIQAGGGIPAISHRKLFFFLPYLGQTYLSLQSPRKGHQSKDSNASSSFGKSSQVTSIGQGLTWDKGGSKPAKVSWQL